MVGVERARCCISRRLRRQFRAQDFIQIGLHQHALSGAFHQGLDRIVAIGRLGIGRYQHGLVAGFNLDKCGE